MDGNHLSNLVNKRQPGLKALALWQSVEDVITWWRSQMQALDMARVIFISDPCAFNMDLLEEVWMYLF